MGTSRWPGFAGPTWSPTSVPAPAAPVQLIEPKKRAFTLLELVLTSCLFLMMSSVLMIALKQVSTVWRRVNAQDDAVRQLLRARTSLQRDLADSSGQAGQFAVAKVGPTRTGFDGDAVTFLSSDSGNLNHVWSTDPVTGKPSLASEITYYLVVPNAPNRYGISPSAGAADAQGYEQQDPFKWLVRRVDPCPPASPPAVNGAWTGWLTRPTLVSPTATQRIIADQMLGFRVTGQPPLWSIQLSAVGVSEAQRTLAIGSVPLSQSKFTLVQCFSVPANN